MKNSLKSTFLRILVFLVIFDLFLTLFFREKQNEKHNEKQLKNATVNYPNDLYWSYQHARNWTSISLLGNVQATCPQSSTITYHV